MLLFCIQVCPLTRVETKTQSGSADILLGTDRSKRISKTIASVIWLQSGRACLPRQTDHSNTGIQTSVENTLPANQAKRLTVFNTSRSLTHIAPISKIVLPSNANLHNITSEHYNSSPRIQVVFTIACTPLSESGIQCTKGKSMYKASHRRRKRRSPRRNFFRASGTCLPKICSLHLAT